MDFAHCTSATDDQLMQAVALGDQVAFAEIYDRYALETFKRVMVQGADKSLAETAVFGVFLDLWRRAPRISPCLQNMSVWFSTNAHPIQMNPTITE
jgi:RNA polymerase sigma-70 factor (ECF subfamily)